MHPLCLPDSDGDDMALVLYEVIATWHAMLESMFSGYRPELYYMRGPGPKCRAKRRLGLRGPHS